ncbi:hypothetical protein DFJ43DRAFT_33976 [Lentinula guzmanii]|uniref:C2H2-type domain-containing protein n=1 Tax=Lentinula guzmanii TaxID=2804957 RepID=A0AA38JM87_9AGAR|nr:hypothetical protein DFJ43DRAFT_33976 [Lentinula guzmanii]
MFFSDTAHLDWVDQYQTPSPQFAREIDTHSVYHHTEADQPISFAGVVVNDSNYNAQTDMSIVCNSSSDDPIQYRSAAFSCQSSEVAGLLEVQSNMKWVPRLDTRVDATGYDYDSFSASTQSWSPSPSSGSTDPCFSYPTSQQYSPPLRPTGSEYTFINGLPCHHDTGPAVCDGRQVSESSELYTLHRNFSAPCTTISPEMLGSDFTQELQHLNIFDDAESSAEVIVRNQVATEKVLAASQRRRTQARPVKRVPPCHLCGATFTAKHNLINHHNSHYGKRPYPCIPQCGRSFGTKHVLRRHQKTCQEYRTSFNILPIGRIEKSG